MEKLPFFALAAAACWITVVVQSAGGSVVAGISLPLGDRVGNALIAYCRYLGKLFWPVDLANYYPHPGHWPLAPVLLAGALLLALSALVFLNRRRWPFLLMGWLWFVGMLVPVIGLKQAGWQSMADRYAYLPSLGIFVLVVWGAAELARVRGGDGASRPPSPLASSASRRLNSRFRFPLSCFSAAGAAAILCCSALTHRQLGYWQNSETLFRHTLAVTGDNNYFARENLGLTLMDQGRLDEAIAQFSQVLRYSPTHYNLGLALALKGDNAAAVREFSEAVRVSPGQVDAHYNLAIALLKTGAAAAAIAEFQEVVRLQPDHVEARYNLGTQLGMAGHLDDAIVQLAAAVRLKPDYVGARHNLALALLNTGQTDAAIAQLQAIVSLRPDDPEARQQLAQVQALKSAPPAP